VNALPLDHQSLKIPPSIVMPRLFLHSKQGVGEKQLCNVVAVVYCELLQLLNAHVVRTGLAQWYGDQATG